MVFLIILGVLIYLLYKNKKTLRDNAGKNKTVEWHSDTELMGERQKESQSTDIDFSDSYQAKYLLTKTNWFNIRS